MSVYERLRELGIAIREPRPPVANYVGVVQAGDLVFVSGHGPVGDGGELVTGKLGEQLTVEDGYEAARLAAIACLSTLDHTIGLARVRRIVKVLGMVNAVPGFERHPQVVNGASDLLVSVFGEAGRHARSAVGMASLPGGIAVEVEMVVQVAEADRER